MSGRYLTINRDVVTMTVFTLMVISGCSCASNRKAKALIRDSGERWVLVGDYTTHREKEGPPKEHYIGTAQIPDGSLTRLIDIPMKTPDGQNVGAIITYNERRHVMVCVTSGKNSTDDVWQYDLATGESRWIAKGKWNNTCGFAWSPDGSKIAFVASTRGPETAIMRYDVDGDNAELNKLMHRRDNKYLYYVSKENDVMRVEMLTAVMQYDVRSGKLEEVANDAWRFGDSSVRPRRPVYSEDGNSLYFISMDQHVTRVDLSTRKITRLPFSRAIVVLTVKGEYLVYAREVGARDDYRFEIVKVRLDSSDSPAGEQILHATHGVIWGSHVSPSRRFVLVRSRAGYGSETRLIDMDQSISLPADGLLWPGGLRARSTVFVGGSP